MTAELSAQAAAAEAAFQAAVQKVREVEAADFGGSELSVARRHRSDTALDWGRLVTAWADMAPGDSAALAALKRAGQAVDRFEMPSGGLKARRGVE